MRCSLLLKALVMYVRYQILPVFAVAFAVIHSFIVSFTPLLVLLKLICLSALHLLIYLIEGPLIHLHHIHDVFLAFSVHVDCHNA